MNTRRNFIRTAGLTTLVGVTGFESVFATSNSKNLKTSGNGLKLSFVPHDLMLKHTFTLANSSRKTHARHAYPY